MVFESRIEKSLVFDNWAADRTTKLVANLPHFNRRRTWISITNIAINAPETIGQLCRRAIQAQCQTHQAAFLQLEDRLTGKERSGARGQRGLHRTTASVLDYCVQVGTLKWIAASEHEHWDAHVGYLIDKVEGFSSGKFQRITVRLGASPAMHAF